MDAVVVPVDGVGEYVTLRQAAQMTGMPYWRVRRYVRGHRIPFLRLGYQYLVKVSDLKGLRA